jgi:hypothetical protein
MADTFYSLAGNKQAKMSSEQVVVGSSTSAGSDIELRIESGAKWNDIKLKQALDAIYERATGGVVKDRVAATVYVKSGG